MSEDPARQPALDEPPPLEFDLFISYARRDASRAFRWRRRDLVAMLKRLLEHHRDPADRKKRFRVCTDSEDFALNDLPLEVTHRLDSSRALAVMCTEHAPERPAVCGEIAAFRARHPDRPVIWIEVDRLPRDLFPEHVVQDPIAADLRVDAPYRSWRRKAVAESHRIVAAAWRIDPKHVHDRFRADERTRRRRRIALAATVALLAAVLTITFNLERGLTPTRVIGTMEKPQNALLVPGPDRPGTFFALGGGAIQRCALDGACSTISDQLLVTGPACATLGLLHVGEGNVLVTRNYDGEIKDRRTAPCYIQQVACRGESVAAAACGELFIGPGNDSLRRVERPTIRRQSSAPSTWPESYKLGFGYELAWSDDAKILAVGDFAGVVYVDPATRQVMGPDVYQVMDGGTISHISLTYDPNDNAFAWPRHLDELEELRIGEHTASTFSVSLPPNLRKLRFTSEEPRLLVMGDAEVRLFRRTAEGYDLDRAYRMPGSDMCLDVMRVGGSRFVVASSTGAIELVEPTVRLFGRRLW